MTIEGAMRKEITLITLYEAMKDAELCNVLYKLTLEGPSSSMRDVMNGVDKYHDNMDEYKVLYYKHNSYVIAWCMLLPRGCYGMPYAWRVAYFFVHSNYRRKGIGSELYKAADDWCGSKEKTELCVCPWDDCSRSFFTHNGATHWD
jgi:GNAT superfamily N-acetyltransferase